MFILTVSIKSKSTLYTCLLFECFINIRPIEFISKFSIDQLFCSLYSVQVYFHKIMVSLEMKCMIAKQINSIHIPMNYSTSIKVLYRYGHWTKCRVNVRVLWCGQEVIFRTMGKIVHFINHWIKIWDSKIEWISWCLG